MNRKKQKELVRRRRNDKFRRRRAKRKYLLWAWSDDTFKSKEAFVRWVDEKAAREAELRSPCSCYMCGNPRRHFGEKTLAELCFEEKYREEIKNV